MREPVGLAPASLCAALMATVVVANALISRALLKEKLERCDYHGGALIMIGISVTASFAESISSLLAIVPPLQLSLHEEVECPLNE